MTEDKIKEALLACKQALSIPNYTSAFDAYVANQREAAYQEARRAAAQFEAELARQRDLAVDALKQIPEVVWWEDARRIVDEAMSAIKEINTI